MIPIPEFQMCIRDRSNGDVFLSRSTCNTKETIEFEGETYPLVKLEISSTSHPVSYTHLDVYKRQPWSSKIYTLRETPHKK